MYRLTGPKKEIEKIKSEMTKDVDAISIVRHTNEGTSSRAAYGMEPLAYLVVVFVGHLAAAVAHDQIKYLMERYLEGKRNVKIEEEQNDDKDKSDDLL